MHVCIHKKDVFSRLKCSSAPLVSDFTPPFRAQGVGGCPIWVQFESGWPQMGQIRDVFRSDFSTFQDQKSHFPEPKYTEI